MNAYLKKTKTPAKTTLKNSPATAHAIEDVFFEDEYEAVREERERSSSFWTRSTFGEIFTGGGKFGRGRGSQLNISGVNGLAGIGIFGRGQSNSSINTFAVFPWMVF